MDIATVTRSMTAFARHEAQTQWGSLEWEIRSVNHRYLEVGFRMEDSFRPLEMAMRKRATERLARGKVEVTLRYRPPEEEQEGLKLNETLARRVIDSYQQLANISLDAAPIDLMRVLQWPGVIESQTPDAQALSRVVLDAFDRAIDDLLATREREG